MDESRTICFCHNVPLKTLLKVIEDGARSLEEIQRQTKASTGCGGCESEVLEILQEWLARHPENAVAQLPESEGK